MRWIYLTLIISLVSCVSTDYYYNSETKSYSKIEIDDSSTTIDTVIDFSTNTISFKNPSFEMGIANHSTVPDEWQNCSDDGKNSPSDLHSNNSSHFQVRKKATDGNQFVGLVVRDDKSVESIGQKLENPLKKDEKYVMQVDLSKSKQWISFSRKALQEIHFTTPCVLNIWASNNSCERTELLYTSPLIKHINWKRYTLEFSIKDDYQYIIFEASYDPKSSKPYYGNLMIDNISPVKMID